MAQISATIHIDADPREVWGVATDLDRIGSWVTIHRDFPDAPQVNSRRDGASGRG